MTTDSQQYSSSSTEKRRRPSLKVRMALVRRHVRITGRRLKQVYPKLKEMMRHSHRFVVMDNETYKEKIAFQLSGINLFITIGILTIVLIILNTLIIAFTPLREYIPGYANSDMVDQTYHNAVLLDSLQRQIEAQEWMIATMQDVIGGKAALTAEAAHRQADSLAGAGVTVADYRHSEADSLLRSYVEENDSRYEVRSSKGKAAAVATTATAPPSTVVAASSRIFFVPVNGTVIDSFNVRQRHYGVDVAGIANSPVNAVASGTVLFANFTTETGYVIAIQHGANVVSVYKHCSALLKREGDVVLAGQPLGYLGNSGSLSSGPHLHFELWIAGKPVDPRQYVIF